MPPPLPAPSATPAPRPSSPSSAGDAALPWQRVVGFDPGLNITGYGVIDCREGIVRLVEAGTIRSRGETLETRLAEVERTKSPKRSAKLAGREHELSAFEGDGE